MSVFMDTVTGFKSFITDYKYLALVICIIVYALFHWTTYKNNKTKTLLLYTVIVMILVMIPITGIVFFLYQTRFYDYGGIWNYLPLTAVLAWGIVTVVFDKIVQLPGVIGNFGKIKKQKVAVVCGFTAALMILFVCGNQGRLKAQEEEQLDMQYASENILQYLEEEDLLRGKVIWAPKDMMQYLRSHNGEVLLFYGRDMWDAKSGAYDYDAYDAWETACYEWMETVSSERNLYLLEVEQAPSYIHEALKEDKYLKESVARKVSVIILPDQTTDLLGDNIREAAKGNGLEVEMTLVEDYALWIFK